MKLLSTTFITITLTLFANAALAQCDCDFIIGLSTTEYQFDGAKKGVKPGDKICFASGTRTGMGLFNINGTPDNPVIITNMCDGEVTLNAPSNWGNCVTIEKSTNFVFHGSGNPNIEYGIHITGGHMGLNLQNLSTNFEVHNIDINTVGCSGILAKTDPTCDPATWRANFTLRDIYIHHNKIANTGCEGFYVGNSHHDTYVTKTCNGVSTKLYEHDILNIEISYNQLTNIGNDGIQVGSTKGAKIHHNTVSGSGVKNNLQHQNLIQLGGGTEGALVYNNYVENGRAYGILDQGNGNTFYNNIIYNTLDAGVILLPDAVLAPTGGRFFNNTFINCKNLGLYMLSENPDPTIFANNIIVGQNQSGYVYFSLNNPSKNKFVEYNNIKTQDITTVKFVNATAKDYRLLTGSPAIDAGTDLTSFGVTFDFDEKPRPGSIKFDIGAFEYQSSKPTANAGLDKSITLPTNTTNLNGTGTSQTGITGYSWTKKSGGAATLTNANTANLTVSDLVEGIYVFQLQVTDANGTALDEVAVTVLPEPPNQNPIASAGQDQIIVLPINTGTLSGAGSDPDGTVASYAWTQTAGPAVTLSNQNTAILSLADLLEGTYEFQLTVTDNDGAVGSDLVTVNVLPTGAQPPVVSIADPSVTIFTPITEVDISATATDADGTISTILWEKQSGPAATLTNANTLTLTASSLVLGTYVFRITVTDNTGLQAFDEITVQVLQGNQSPTANASADKSITLPTSTTIITGSGTDSDGIIASYLWVQVSGPSCTLVNESTSTLTVNNMLQGTYIFGLTVTDDDGATGYDEIKVTVNSAPPNVSPSANAGSDKTITLPQSTLNLVGTASDSDGTITTILWTKKSGPTAVLTNANTLTLALSSLVAGTYTFTLTVTDDDGASKQDDVIVTVLPATVNQAPIANAGANVFLTLPTNSVTINGIGSDTDGTIASYSWTKVSGPAGTATGTTTSTLQLSSLVAGTYIYTFTVTDDDGATSTDDVSIFVSSTNLLPTVNAGENQTVIQPASSVQLTATAADKDGSIATYAWTKQSGPTTTLVDANTATLTANSLLLGTYVFRITVTDNSGATAFDEVIVTVIASTANQLPLVNTGNDREVFLPTNSIVISSTVSDPDGTISTYAWTQVSGPAALLSNTNTNALTALNLLEGTAVFRLTVTDNDGGSSFDEVSVIVHPSTVNQAPAANAGSNRIIQLPTNALNLTGTGTDADGTIASYAWIKVSGPQATLTGANTATLKLTGLVEGSYTFRLTVTDNLGATGTSDVAVSVLPATVNKSPIASAGQNQVITLPQSSTNLAGSAFDADGTIATYAWTKASGPAGGTLSSPGSQVTSITGLIEGVYVYNLTVTDNLGATGTDAITITVLNSTANKPPIANAGGNQTITLPTNAINLFGSGFDADGSIVSYQWTKLTGGTVTQINANTKTLSLSNLQAGQYTFRLRVTDNLGATGDDVATLVVNGQATNVAPVAFAGADKVVKLPSSSTTLAGSGTDIDGQIVAFSWSQVSGATAVLGATNTSSLSISNLALGFYKFRLTVTDNVQSTAFDEVIVQVVSSTTNLPPVINLGADKSLILPTNQITITATVTDDGTISAYLWNQISGPTATMVDKNVKDLQLQNLVEGTYTFQLTAADNLGASSSKTVKVTVSPFVNSPPVVNAGADVEITLPINQTTLTGVVTEPDGTSFTMQWSKVSGGTATESGNTGLSLQLTNLVAGTYVYKLEATDPSNAIGSDLVTVLVNPVPPNQPPIVNAGTNQSIELPLNTATISGTATDTDGVKGVAWTQTQGPNTATLVTPNNLETVVSNLIEGTYTFRLTATDNLDASSFSEISIFVLTPVVTPDDKFPPIASAGDDVLLTAPENSTVLLGQGVPVTPDASINTYLWEQISGPSLTLTTPNSNLLELTDLTGGTYAFRFTVIDSDNLSATDEVIVYMLEEKDEIPKFFSPNNDGTGDVWVFRNSDSYNNCQLQVLSRTGQEVYQANPYLNDWGGLLNNGKALPDGDYYYILNCTDGRQIKGAVRIIR